MNFWKKNNPSDEDISALEDLQELTKSDEGVDKTFEFMDKITGLDVDEMEKDIEESRVKLDFVVFSVHKLVGLMETVLNTQPSAAVKATIIRDVVDDVDNEFKQKVKPLYEDND